MQQTISLKFGGTSMGSAESILECANIVKKYKANKLIVTVSAVSKITDYLLNIIENLKRNQQILIKENINFLIQKHIDILKQISTQKTSFKIFEECMIIKIQSLEKIMNECQINNNQITSKIEAKICSFGEKLSSYLIVAALNEIGLQSERVESEEIIKTNSNYLDADLNWNKTYNLSQKKLDKIITQGKIPVITGFIGSDNNNDTTLLGRGGSDYTASILAAITSAKEIQIWTDVDGVMSADPRVIQNAKLLKKIDIEIVGEMANCGAKVLHHKSINCAVEKKIPVFVFNTFNRSSQGTMISNFPRNVNKTISVVSSSKNILYHLSKISMNNEIGFIARVSNIVEDYNVSIDICITSETTFSFSTKENANSKEIFQKLQELCSATMLINISKISIIGYGITNETILKSISVLIKNKIKVHSIMFGKSERNITILVDDVVSQQSVELLHNELI